MKKVLLSLAVLGMISMASAQCFNVFGPEQLVNGGFETGDLQGWAYYEDYPYDGDGPPVDYPGHMEPSFPPSVFIKAPAEGDMYMGLTNGSSGRGFIFQEIPVVPSNYYCISGYMWVLGTEWDWATPAANANAQVYAVQGPWMGPSNPGAPGPPTGNVVTIIDVTSPPPSADWIYFEVCVHAEDSLLTIVLAGANDWAWPMVAMWDGISVREQAIPEPGTMLLLGTGLIGLVGLARRK